MVYGATLFSSLAEILIPKDVIFSLRSPSNRGINVGFVRSTGGNDEAALLTALCVALSFIAGSSASSKPA